MLLTFPGYSANIMFFDSSAYQQFGPNNSRYPANATVAALNTLDGLGCFLFARHY